MLLDHFKVEEYKNASYTAQSWIKRDSNWKVVLSSLDMSITSKGKQRMFFKDSTID